MNHWIVTANRLSDGGVAYLAADGRWSGDVQRAWRGVAEAAQRRLEWARGQEAVICDPYVLEVGVVAGALRPLTTRERIRAEGPTPTLQRLGYLPLEQAPQRAVG